MATDAQYQWVQGGIRIRKPESHQAIRLNGNRSKGDALRPTQEGLERGRRRRRIEAIEEARRMREERDL